LNHKLDFSGNMTYSKSTLAKIGKEVVSKHPQIASSILQQISTTKPVRFDLAEIPGLFKEYCSIVNIDPESLKGPVFKSSINEDRKVFISVIICMYGEVWGLKKAISDTINIFPQNIGTMTDEIKFRYAKDMSFTEKVNSILIKIITSPDGKPQITS